MKTTLLRISCLGYMLLAAGCTNLPVDNVINIITNIPPVVPNVITNVVPAPILPDASSQDCFCDLSAPVCDPPYGGEYLASRGNAEEAPMHWGLDFRMIVLYTSHNRLWNIGSLIPDACTRLEGRSVKVKCFDKNGYRYHLLGATLKENRKPELAVKPGDIVDHPHCRYWFVFEPRKIK